VRGGGGQESVAADITERQRPQVDLAATHSTTSTMLHKFGLKDRLELTRYAIRVGLIEP
jgi:hypothetical protein